MTAKSIAATRWDGFGSRMFAFLNAQWLAEELDVPFEFHWPPLELDDDFHGVPPREEVFEPAYLEGLHRDRRHFERHLRLERNSVEREALLRHLADESNTGLVFDVPSLVMTLDGAPPGPEVFPRLWQAIGFSPRLREVMEVARSLVPTRAVGVHLRRGDLIHNDMRRWTFREKFQPLAWYKHSLTELVAEGVPVIVFADDASTLSTLADGWPVGLAGDLPGALQLTRFERTVFELTALSSCAYVVGARGAFAVLASQLGRVPLVPAAHGLDASSRLRLALDDLDRHPEHYDVLSHAKELQWLSLDRDLPLDGAMRDRLLAEAIELDPGNETNLHLLAVGCLDRGEFAAADALLRRAAVIAFERSGGLDVGMHVTDWTPYSLLRESLGRVPEETRSQYPYVLSLQMAFEGEAGPGINLESRAARALAGDPSSDILLARYCRQLLLGGRNDEVRTLLSAAIREGRQPAIFHLLMARAGVATGDWPMALGHARALVRRAPGEASARALLGLCLAQTGDTARATDYLGGLVEDEVTGLAKDWLRQARAILAGGSET